MPDNYINEDGALTQAGELSLIRHKLGAKTLEELESEAPVTEQDHWLIPGFVSTSDTLLYGQSKSGKSYIAAQLVASLVDGRPCLDREPLSSGHRVVIVALDGGAVKEYQQRLAGLGVPQSSVELIQGTGTLAPDFWEDLEGLVKFTGATVVVFDHATSGITGDFNSVEGWRDLWNHLKDLGDGVARVLVAHATDSKFEGKTIHRPSGSFNATATARSRLYVHAPFGVDDHRRELRLLSNTRESEAIACVQGEGGYFQLNPEEQANTKYDREQRTQEVNAEIVRLALVAPAQESQADALEWIRNQDTVKSSDGESFSPGSVRNKLHNSKAVEWDKKTKRYKRK